ncbi:MAG: serine hydrolase domain-containing protein [Planctomycetota bacterium]
MGTSIVTLASCAAVLTWSVAQEPSARERALAEFQARLVEDVLADDIGSIATGVSVGVELIFAEGIGLRDRARELDAGADTIYRIGSIAKPITAVTLMVLVRRGTVALDDPVVKHLPEFAGLGGGVPAARAITLRQLASHTAGLAREPELEGADAGPIAQWEEKVLASIPKTALGQQPGAAFAYSNIGYGILGLALSRAAREPFPELVHRLVFEPLGMTSSSFVVAPSLAARLALGYEQDGAGNIDGEQAAREHAGRGYKVPNGGVYSTAADLGRFMALMSGALGDDVLDAPARAEMLKRQTPVGGEAYGLGFSLTSDAQGNEFVAHSGGIAGYTAQLVFHPRSRIGVVLLRNYAGGRVDLQQRAEGLLTALVAAEKKP